MELRLAGATGPKDFRYVPNAGSCSFVEEVNAVVAI